MNVMRNLRVKKDKAPSVVSGIAGTLGNTLVLAQNLPLFPGCGPNGTNLCPSSRSGQSTLAPGSGRKQVM